MRTFDQLISEYFVVEHAMPDDKKIEVRIDEIKDIMRIACEEVVDECAKEAKNHHVGTYKLILNVKTKIK